MKTIIKLLSIPLLSIGLMFVSCAETDKNEPAPPQPGNEGYISLKLAAGSLATPSRTAQDSYATAAEQKVTKALWLFYAKNGKLAYSFPLTLSNGNGESNFTASGSSGLSSQTPASPVRFVSAAVKIMVAEYDMVVLLNPTAEIEARCSNTGQTLAGLNDVLAIANASAVSTFTSTAQGFFMSNANGPVPVGPSNFFEDAVTAESGTNPVQVKVDRAIAKVAVASRVGGTVVQNGTLTALQWKLIRVNTKMYPYRKYAYFYNYEAGNTPKETYATSIAESRRNIYAEDPNYDSYVAGDLVDETDGLFVDWNEWSSGSSVSLDSYKYLLENTAFAQENTNAFSAVLIHATIANPDKDKTYGTTYYSFNGKTFTHALARTWLAGTFPAELTGLKAAIEADAARGSSRLFRFDLNEPSGLPASYVVSPEGITFHKDGLNKYLVNLKHFGTIAGAAAGKYGYYGVVRNNIYLVAINNLTGPGSWTPVDPPVPPTDSYISADVTILPWYVRDNGTILE